MSFKEKSRKILLCLVLGAGSMMGVPMDPKQVEELLHAMNQTRVEVTITDKEDEGEPK